MCACHPFMPVNWPQTSSSTRWGPKGSWCFSCPQLSVLEILKRSAMSNSAWRIWFPKRWAFCGNRGLRRTFRIAPTLLFSLGPQADSSPPETERASGLSQRAPLPGNRADSPSLNLRTCWKRGRTWCPHLRSCKKPRSHDLQPKDEKQMRPRASVLHLPSHGLTGRGPTWATAFLRSAPSPLVKEK